MCVATGIADAGVDTLLARAADAPSVPEGVRDPVLKCPLFETLGRQVVV